MEKGEAGVCVGEGEGVGVVVGVGVGVGVTGCESSQARNVLPRIDNSTRLLATRSNVVVFISHLLSVLLLPVMSYCLPPFCFCLVTL